MSEKIKPQHQQRLAVVYIRQSSLGQVKNHRESYRIQKRLTQRAAALGWSEGKIKTIEGDQGVSASTPQTRDDFNALLQMVRDQQVGIVFGFDVARLARNSLDWSLLIHWCAMHGTLIGDQHLVYDPAVPQAQDNGIPPVTRGDEFTRGIRAIIQTVFPNVGHTINQQQKARSLLRLPKIRFT